MAATTDLFKVEGLVAVISGGGTGIGLMMAKALAQNGAARVYIIGRRLDRLQSAAKEHSNIFPLQGDVTSKEDLTRMVSQVEQEVGYIHFLVCNSGRPGPTVEKLSPTANLAEIREFMWAWEPKDFNDTYALNDTAAFFTVIAFLGLLEAGNKSSTRTGIQSSVLITASVAAHMRQLATGVAYITSKAATLQLAKLLSTFLGPHGIRVNALCPGIFPSESSSYLKVVASGYADSVLLKGEMTSGRVGQSSGFSLDSVPVGRAGTEEDMRGTVLWLASRAGAYTNGLTVLLDGGRLSQLPATY